MSDWQEEVTKALPGRWKEISYSDLWAYPDKHLASFTPQDLKSFAWKLASLGATRAEEEEAATEILLLCHMSLRGNLALPSQEIASDDFQAIIGDLSTCVNNGSTSRLRSAARAAMSTLLLHIGTQEEWQREMRNEVLSFIVNDSLAEPPKDRRLDVQDALLAFAFALEALTPEELNTVMKGPVSLLRSKSIEKTLPLELRQTLFVAVNSPPMRDLQYLWEKTYP